MGIRECIRPTTVLLAICIVTGLGSAPSGGSTERQVRAELVFDCGGCAPVAFTFTPNGKQIFYLERVTGEIHRYTLKGGSDSLWGSVGPVNYLGEGERGGLGIAVDPKWNQGKKRKRDRNRWIYVYFTHDEPLENRIVRLRHRLRGDGTIEQRLETISIGSGSQHNAGTIHFGPDGKLYVMTGDQDEPARSQSTADVAGKVLRMNPGGRRPDDNPIPGSLAYSFGHRNSFGFAFDPITGNLWQTENGPTCEDELNLIIPGRNYGWGTGSDCPGTSTEGPDPVQPERTWTPPIVPTGATFCDGCGLGSEIEGDLLVGFYTRTIRNFTLDAERDDIIDEAVTFDHSGGVVAIQSRPNGQIFFSDTSGIYVLTA
ncbi:MAG: PQQ-dependent sugar dehydrogenase [Actinomycetota bacterium]